MMNGSFDTVYFDSAESMSLQEMVECDIQEMDFNFNDPLFADQHTFAAPDSLQRATIKQEGVRPSPGDLTNLQWLQNVSIPMEKGSSNKEQVMVDPNTALPVQWSSQEQFASTSSMNVNSSVAVPQIVHQTRVVECQPKAVEPCAKTHSKDKAKTQDKPYPKPVFSYSCLIAMALKNSDNGTLPVCEIYKFMMGKFPYFKTAPDGWKNSVRHNLSLNKAFCKLERPQGGSQRKGCLWSLKPERREQMDKEILKWKKKHCDALRASMVTSDELDISSEGLDEYATTSIVNVDNVEDKAAADAAKELFGNNLIQEIQHHEVLDWDDIISSNHLPIAPTLATTTTTVVHSACDPITTTVELDNSAQYYGNTNSRQEYDFQMQYASHYYSVPPQPRLHVGF